MPDTTDHPETRIELHNGIIVDFEFAVASNFYRCVFEEVLKAQDLGQRDFEGCDFPYNIHNIHGTDAYFHDCNFDGDFFEDAVMPRAMFIACTFVNVDIVRFKGKRSCFRGSVFEGVRFRYCDFNGADLRAITMKNCTFTGCTLLGAMVDLNCQLDTWHNLGYKPDAEGYLVELDNIEE
jgi:uncharacterized protein YjbI with pentapeptide repeats